MRGRFIGETKAGIQKIEHGWENIRKALAGREAGAAKAEKIAPDVIVKVSDIPFKTKKADLAVDDLFNVKKIVGKGSVNLDKFKADLPEGIKELKHHVKSTDLKTLSKDLKTPPKFE